MMTFKQLQFLISALVLCAGSAQAGSYRFHSPSGKYDIVMQTLPDDWSSVKKADKGKAKGAMKQYGIDLYPARSSEPVNSIVYSDINPPMPPEQVLASMVWSPNEAFVFLPDRQKAREPGHVLLLVASLSTNKLWGLEADHAVWVDEHRFVGDLNHKEIPGAIVMFDGTRGKADILIQANSGIGYQIASVSGHHVTVTEILNDRGMGKTTWEKFVPACFDLDLDTLKKNSTDCPAVQKP
jgi:hypothetical protein